MASVDWKKTNVPTMARMGIHFDNKKREKSNHSNEDINKELTKNNYYLGCKDWNDLISKNKNFIQEIDTIFPPKKKQDDNERITMVALNIPCPRIITDIGQSKDFFKKVNELLTEKFSGYSGMAVHVDEVHEYLDNGKLMTSCEHGHAFVPAYAEWQQTTKKGVENRQGINGKNFVTKQAMIELNNDMNELCLQNFGIPYNTGEKAKKLTVEQLKQGEYKELKKEIQSLKQQKFSNKKEIYEQEDKLINLKTEYDELEASGNKLNDKLKIERENLVFIKKETDLIKNEMGNLHQNLLLNAEESQDFVDNLHTAFLQGIYAGRKIESEGMDDAERESFINNTVQKLFKFVQPTIAKIQNNNQILNEKLNEKRSYFNQILEKRKEKKSVDKVLNQIRYENYFEIYFDRNGEVSEKSEKHLERQIQNTLNEKTDNKDWQNLQSIYLDLDQNNREKLVNYIKKDCIFYLKDHNANLINNIIENNKLKQYAYKNGGKYSAYGTGLLQKYMQMQQRIADDYER